MATKGNEDCHVILRGGADGPNYSAKHVASAAEILKAAGLAEKVMVDFSHANSSKQFKKQMDVAQDIAEQIKQGGSSIFGRDGRKPFGGRSTRFKRG